jgi:hypothetical protein
MNRIQAFVSMTMLALASPAFAAKNQISGQVLDRNGEPVTRAIVTLAPGNVQMITDDEGKFLIDYLRSDAGERVKLARKTDYDLEVFKPGYHIEKRNFFYKRGVVEVDAITLSPETVKIAPDTENIDPALFSDKTQGSGATYEGQ